jgi:uncharacterized protein involved in exopolysaccharide biosynthesis
MTTSYSNQGDELQSSGHLSASSRGQLDLFDVIALAWSERGFIVLVFAILFAAGATASVLLLKPSYQAHLPLIVMLEDNAAPATAGLGGAFMLDQIMQSESELLNSEAVRRRALASIGPAAVLGEAGLINAEPLALRAMREGFTVTRAPNATVLTASYNAPSADTSARVLNAIVDAYLIFREDVLVEVGFEGVVERRRAADLALVQTQNALDEFLATNDLVSFAADQAAAEASVATLQDRLRTARVDRDAAAAGVTALGTRISNVPSQIELYTENGVTSTLLDLRAERARLLSRYQPTAPAVIAIDREIAAMTAFIATGAPAGQGVIRTGLNPVRQAMETDLAVRQTNARTAAERVIELERQLRTARAEIARLRPLESEFTLLTQSITAATSAAAGLASQEAAAAARRSGTAGAADSVRVFERALPPFQATSMKKLGIIASFVIALGTAMFFGLIRGYWRGYIDARAARPVSAPRQPSNPAQSGPASVPSNPEIMPAIDELADLPVLARIGDRAA